MLIASWNVNSVRARISNILDYLKASNTDVLMIQEIKTKDFGTITLILDNYVMGVIPKGK